MRIDELVAGELPARRTISVDVSALIDEEPGTTVLAYREPTLSEFLRVRNTSQYYDGYRKRFPGISEEMAMLIELLSCLHEEPAITEMSYAEFYYKLSRLRPAVFLYVSDAVFAEFNLEQELKKVQAASGKAGGKQ